MNILDFLIYLLDKHSGIFAVVVVILAMGVATMLSNLFYNEHQAEVDTEHERHFWRK